MDNFYGKYNNWNNRNNKDSKNKKNNDEEWDLDSYLFGWKKDNFYSNQNKSVNTNKSFYDKHISIVDKDDEIRNLKTELEVTKEDLDDAKSELKYTKKKLYDYKTKAEAFDKLFELFKDKFNRNINYKNVTDHHGAILSRYKESEIYSLNPLTSGEVFKIIKIFFDALGYDNSDFENHWETTNVETVNDNSWDRWYHFYRNEENKYK